MKKVSILIAARNEEDNIMDCLQALTHLTYPAGALEILIGNDHSEDRTPDLISHFIQHKPHFQLLNITHTIAQTKGKANVLAQLALQATGDYFFITDADIQVPPDWIQTMLDACKPGVGIITGMTIIKGNTLFHQLQAIDWVLALGLVKLASDVQVPVTAMGNNMMVTRKAYQATGGYHQLPFSVTEDYALFRAVVSKGFEFKHLLQTEVLASTKPVYRWQELMQQRKRWASGAMQLPFYFVVIFMLQALFFPVMLILLFFFPIPAMVFWLFKWMVQGVFIGSVLLKLKHFQLLKYIFLYEFYYAFVSLSTLLMYLLPGKIQWKGRSY